jgi:dTMP kinase
VFVTFEGLDGSGKSTQAELLRASLAGRGRQVVATREPGGTALGERIRELVLDGPDMSAWAEASLFAAARAELADEVIRPALARGADVVCDRYIDSSLAYQGIARGLGVERVLELNVAVVDLMPDRTFVLLVEPVRAAARVGDRPDRIERAGDRFLADVDDGYRQLVERFPQRVRALDAGLPAEEISRLVLDDLRARV